MMAANKPHIDPYLFERQFEAFKMFVEEQSGSTFTSFASNWYTENQEGYKYEVHRAARDALSYQTWKKADIGSGKIVSAVIKSIELPDNNLVPWDSRHGVNARPHKPLFEAKNTHDTLSKVEECFFNLYHEEQDEKSFTELVGIFGGTYPLLAYFFFLKDRSKYLPIRPTYFDLAFKYLGADFKTNRRCSWENYLIYIALIDELKTKLTESLSREITLLDAHSFAWILANQMTEKNKLPDVQNYLNLSSSDRDAIVKARIGQGRFRECLIDYWGAYAVTNCAEMALLRASHIKPWAMATLTERLNLYNGLLLSPALDACFDTGYISFDDQGRILISNRLKIDDSKALGIYPEMCIKRVEMEHKKYLAFHREHIFKK